MHIFSALTVFIVIILIYLIITEIFTVLFRLTGLPDEKSRLQVMSLLTGCGFTTKESEMIASSRTRRRLARITMLFGYVFNVTIVSTLINLFFTFRLSEVKSIYNEVILPLAVAVAVFAVLQIRTVRVWSDHQIEKIFGIFFRKAKENTVLLMDYIGHDALVKITLRKIPDAMEGKKLAETGLKAVHNIIVLLVEHSGEKTEPASAATVFEPGDTLTVFGDYGTIGNVFAAREKFDTED